MMKTEPICIYNCEGLQNLYRSNFNGTHHVVFCATDLVKTENTDTPCSNSILYAGNLGVGRHKALMDVADAIQTLDNELCVDIYGSADDAIRQELQNTKGACYHGLVSYAENCRNMYNSRLLIHVESFDPFYHRDTRYAFSTKLADYCASGVPILVYAPVGCESVKYLQEHQAAFIATNKDELVSKLEKALFDEFAGKECVNNALKLAKNNHQVKTNQQLFWNIITANAM